MKVINWKTSLSGVAALLAIAAKIASGSGVEADDIALIAAALGLFFSKDKNVTGGTKRQ